MGRKLARVPDALKMKRELIYRITSFPHSLREPILEGSLGPATSVTTRTFKESSTCTLTRGQEQAHTSVQALKQRTPGHFSSSEAFLPKHSWRLSGTQNIVHRHKPGCKKRKKMIASNVHNTKKSQIHYLTSYFETTEKEPTKSI